VTDIYRVTAPYVVLRSKSDQGGDVALGYLAGASLPETVDLEDLARHIRKGMVEKVAQAAAAEAPAEESAEEAKPAKMAKAAAGKAE
jgi:hypothetical protein